MELNLPPEAHAALTPHLPELRERLLGPDHAGGGLDGLDVRTQEKGNGVLVVTVRAEVAPGQHGLPTTATFELQPHPTEGGLGYTPTATDYSSADY
ncbi:hypothetical protein [Deinococcus navajonensis]|uniref:Uncharacterized protein n=1 Tax=Deinococcus navajonensis TaxID=309884 RepID=A0ABV8XUJ8_9DEIO